MKNTKFETLNSKQIRNSSKMLLIAVLLVVFFTQTTLVFAQTPDPVIDPNDAGFKIVVCDGPTGANPNDGTPYVPCDFNGVMRQVQHLINIAMVLGVLIAIVMFSYAGLLYISGEKTKIDKAHSIFPKVFFGFIIMLSAWFIIYQLLSWLTKNEGFKALLGTP